MVKLVYKNAPANLCFFSYRDHDVYFSYLQHTHETPKFVAGDKVARLQV